MIGREHFVLFLAVVFFVTGSILVVWVIQKKAVDRISSRKKALLVINSRYSFYKIETNVRFPTSVDSKAKFDRFDFDGYMMDTIEEDRAWFDEWISQTESNAENYQRYTQEVQDIPKNRIKKEARIVGISEKRFMAYERELIQKNMLSPAENISAVCELFYTSPQGRNSYKSAAFYTLEDLKRLCEKVDERNAMRSTAAWERAKMTPSLRYRILRRDGFRCQLCGRTAADGAKLHVDHIYPIAKGGRTEESNLRTLCERCNQGKGSQYDPDGIN